jgi:hypothetical protein
MQPYTDLPGFEELYLEDSWVLDVVAHPQSVEVVCEFVLCEGHPRFGPPQPGEQQCYSRGVIRFSGVRRLDWTSIEGGEVLLRPAVDRDGSVDWGNIDHFEFGPNLFDLEGNFGHLRIEADACEVAMASATD